VNEKPHFEERRRGKRKRKGKDSGPEKTTRKDVLEVEGKKGKVEQVDGAPSPAFNLL